MLISIRRLDSAGVIASLVLTLWYVIAAKLAAKEYLIRKVREMDSDSGSSS